MTAFTDLATGLFAVDEPITSDLGIALRDNPVAIAEGDADAPVLQQAWHPYDRVLNGDGNDGLVYDFGVSGAVASVETPDFDDGYEYQAVFVGIEHTTVSTQNLQINLFRETTGSYAAAATLVAIGTGDGVSGHVTMPFVRLSRAAQLVQSDLARHSANTNGVNLTSAMTAQKVTKAKFDFDAGNVTTGKIYLLRRLHPYV